MGGWRRDIGMSNLAIEGLGVGACKQCRKWHRGGCGSGVGCGGVG